MKEREEEMERMREHVFRHESLLHPHELEERIFLFRLNCWPLGFAFFARFLFILFCPCELNFFFGGGGDRREETIHHFLPFSHLFFSPILRKLKILKILSQLT
jgi:hypothetical protein